MAKKASLQWLPSLVTWRDAGQISTTLSPRSDKELGVSSSNYKQGPSTKERPTILELVRVAVFALMLMGGMHLLHAGWDWTHDPMKHHNSPTVFGPHLAGALDRIEDLPLQVKESLAEEINRWATEIRKLKPNELTAALENFHLHTVSQAVLHDSTWEDRFQHWKATRGTTTEDRDQGVGTHVQKKSERELWEHIQASFEILEDWKDALVQSGKNWKAVMTRYVIEDEDEDSVSNHTSEKTQDSEHDQVIEQAAPIFEEWKESVRRTGIDWKDAVEDILTHAQKTTY